MSSKIQQKCNLHKINNEILGVVDSQQKETLKINKFNEFLRKLDADHERETRMKGVGDAQQNPSRQ